MLIEYISEYFYNLFDSAEKSVHCHEGALLIKLIHQQASQLCFLNTSTS